MSSGILKVLGTDVVDGDGKPVILRGAGLGGWMNMENFITGYPGHECQHRAAMHRILGPERADFFFDKFLEYFFQEADAKFFASLRLNCIRIPFNYRHFEDDMNPRVLKEDGFRHLDRVVALCAKEKIYTILDMHAVPGGQNPDWHSDNVTNHAAFWDHKGFQDRAVWLWEEIAKHYAGNPWIAGYNPLNEPADSQHVRLPAFYERVEKAIRKVDPEHILWLDGNTFAMEWKGFDKILPNCVYALHDYSVMGFPTGDRFKGTPEQLSRLEKQFLRKAEFMHQHKTPIWNGEFGPVYASPELDGAEEAASVNQDRYNLLGAQLQIYDQHRIHWSIWLYKDIGVQGMMHTSPDSPWNKAIADFQALKRRLQADAWGKYPSEEVERVIKPVIAWIDTNVPAAKETYPTSWPTERHIARLVNQVFVAQALEEDFARIFEGMGEAELEELAKSFAFENCVQREGLNKILTNHAAASSGKE